MSDKKFEELLELQGDVVRRVHESLEDLDTYIEEIENSENTRNEDTEEAFEDVCDSLKKINKLIDDEMFKEVYQSINYENEDFGIESIQAALAYVCENYQFEKSIIRNRRSEDEDYNIRQLVEIPYDMQTNFNNTEYNVYRELALWIESQSLNYEIYMNRYKKVVSAFFSSASAFKSSLAASHLSIPSELLQLAMEWEKEELANCRNISDYMEIPLTMYLE